MEARIINVYILEKELKRQQLGVFFGERFFLFGEFFFSNWGINVFKSSFLLNLEINKFDFIQIFFFWFFTFHIIISKKS